MSTGRMVYKHELPMGQYLQWVEVIMTAEAKILAIGTQGDSLGSKLVLWEEHPASLEAKEVRAFLVVGTGVLFEAPPQRRMVHIGTAIVPAYGSDYVWHVYEAKLY